MSYSISGKTRVCAVIGDPIEHTMSPAMHNAAFRARRLDHVYLAFRVKTEELGQAIAGMRALNMIGLNVTVPHKTAVIPYLDALDPLAERIGAVNTIVNEGGVLTGYNTDATGFITALQETGVEPEGKSVVILGAGGAARAIAFALAQSGASLAILNRTRSKAADLAASVASLSGRDVAALQFSREHLAQALGQADILVNCTSVGMAPESGETPVDAGLLRPGLVVFDIVYNPIKTRLLREAAAAGARAIDGASMLVWQGALAFERWTGVKAPVGIMRRRVLEVLGGQED